MDSVSSSRHTNSNTLATTQLWSLYRFKCTIGLYSAYTNKERDKIFKKLFLPLQRNDLYQIAAKIWNCTKHPTTNTTRHSSGLLVRAGVSYVGSQGLSMDPVIPKTLKLAVYCLPRLTTGIIRPALQLVGPVSVYYEACAPIYASDAAHVRSQREAVLKWSALKLQWFASWTLQEITDIQCRLKRRQGSARSGCCCCCCEMFSYRLGKSERKTKAFQKRQTTRPKPPKFECNDRNRDNIYNQCPHTCKESIVCW